MKVRNLLAILGASVILGCSDTPKNISEKNSLKQEKTEIVAAKTAEPVALDWEVTIKENPQEPLEGSIDLGDGQKIEFVRIPEIEYVTEKDVPYNTNWCNRATVKVIEEENQRRFKHAPFYIAKTEVTKRQWQRILHLQIEKYESLPELKEIRFNSEKKYLEDNKETLDNPIEGITPIDAERFMAGLDSLDRDFIKEDRIITTFPTPYQWMRAILGEEKFIRYNLYIIEKEEISIPEYKAEKPYPVKKFPPNSEGIYGLEGNVAEFAGFSEIKDKGIYAFGRNYMSPPRTTPIGARYFGGDRENKIREKLRRVETGFRPVIPLYYKIENKTT